MHQPPDSSGSRPGSASRIDSLSLLNAGPAYPQCLRSLHGSEAAGREVPVWVAIGGQLFELAVCPHDAARLCDELSPVLARARRTLMPGWLPGPQAPAGQPATGPMPKRDLILHVLRTRIADGTYPAGTYLPTQRDLAGEHGMSPQPVRRACWELERDGLIRLAARGRYIVQPVASAVAGASQPPGSDQTRTAEGHLAGDPAGCPVCGAPAPASPAGPSAVAAPPIPGRTAQILTWMTGNCHRADVTAAEIAEVAGVSVRRLQAIFRHDLGRSPLRVLADMRLHRAHLALTGRAPAPASLGEAASLAGYSRIHRFRAAYRQRYGRNPVLPAPAASPDAGHPPLRHLSASADTGAEAVLP